MTEEENERNALEQIGILRLRGAGLAAFVFGFYVLYAQFGNLNPRGLLLVAGCFLFGGFCVYALQKNRVSIIPESSLSAGELRTFILPSPRELPFRLLADVILVVSVVVVAALARASLSASGQVSAVIQWTAILIGLILGVVQIGSAIVQVVQG